MKESAFLRKWPMKCPCFMLKRRPCWRLSVTQLPDLFRKWVVDKYIHSCLTSRAFQTVLAGFQFLFSYAVNNLTTQQYICANWSPFNACLLFFLECRSWNWTCFGSSQYNGQHLQGYAGKTVSFVCVQFLVPMWLQTDILYSLVISFFIRLGKSAAFFVFLGTRDMKNLWLLYESVTCSFFLL